MLGYIIKMNLDQRIAELKALGNELVEYNFPLADPKNEDYLHPLKVSDIVVDGYDIIAHYSKSKYPGYFLEVIQVFSKYSKFLPFSVVCKIGKKFLGDEHLSFLEVVKEGKKVYFWTLYTDPYGDKIPDPNKSKMCSFEGFRYSRVNPQQLKFF